MKFDGKLSKVSEHDTGIKLTSAVSVAKWDEAMNSFELISSQQSIYQFQFNSSQLLIESFFSILHIFSSSSALIPIDQIQ